MTHRLFDGEDHTEKYRLRRPKYSKELFEHILNYYFNDKHADEKIPRALDVGCGNGQATVDLSLFCKHVIGIDVSADQLAHAFAKDNIEYRCNAGEDLSFLSTDSIDLITIATTLHWLDVEKFVEEAKRVLKPDTGVLAIWTYTFGTLDNPMAERIYYEFHHGLLHPYWDPKQRFIDDYYQSLVPLFPYKSTLREYTIDQQIKTTLGDFLGLLETASACQTYRKQNGEQAYQDILNKLRSQLSECYRNTNVSSNIDKPVDVDSIKLTVLKPIRLYLMKKKLT